MTATPRKARITFPENPFDGQQVTEIIDDASCVIWTYRAEDNSWVYQIYGLPQEVIYTDQVLVRDNAGEARESDPTKLKTQKDVNWYLSESQPEVPSLDGYATEQWVTSQNYAQRDELPEAPSLDGYATQQWVQNQNYATQQQLAQLQQEVDNLSGLVVQARYSNGNGISTRPGEFVVLKDDTQQTRFSAGEVIRFHETDASNKAPALVRIIIGDLIHIANPKDGTFTVLQVTQAAGIVQSYTCLGGTMDTIPNNTALEFRISGASQ